MVVHHAYRRVPFLVVVVGIFGCVVPLRAADSPSVAFSREPGKIHITVGGRDVATYVYRDDAIPRPYFAHVHAPNGTQVTRNHPPVESQDLTDHATYHPGIWLAFGDINGADFWRNRARVEHEAFVTEPTGGLGRGTFAVRNRYVAGDGKTVCHETARYTLLVRPSGYLLLWASEFVSGDGDFVFGDQEEMGLGVRVATPLTVQRGGEILNSEGRRNEKQVWGRQADWCDYRGVIDGHRVGITLLPDPNNFRRSWFHARDYGLLLANAFGRNAFKAGDKSRVVVKKGKRFRLRYGVLLHSSPKEQSIDLLAAYRDFIKHITADGQ